MLLFHGRLKDSEGVHREQSSARRPDAAYPYCVSTVGTTCSYVTDREEKGRLKQSKNAKHLLTPVSEMYVLAAFVN